LVNEGETYSQTCGKYFKKGWTPTGESQQTVKTRETEVLKTYSNSVFNYSFQYPPSVEVYQTDLSGISDVVTLASPTDRAIYIQSSNDTTKSEVSAILKISTSTKPTFSEKDWNIEETQLNQVNFTKYVNKNETNGQIILVTPLKISNKYLWIYTNSKTDQRNLANQILYTFKFIQTDNTSANSLKTYTNPNYGFSFQYPSEFSITQDTTEKTQFNYHFDNGDTMSPALIIRYKRSVDIAKLPQCPPFPEGLDVIPLSGCIGNYIYGQGKPAIFDFTINNVTAKVFHVAFAGDKMIRYKRFVQFDKDTVDNVEFEFDVTGGFSEPYEQLLSTLKFPI